MAASKKKIVESFSEVSGIGPAYAEQLYDEFGLRSLADLIAAGEKGELQKLRGVGAAKEKAIVKSANELLSKTAKPEKAPEKKSGGAKKAGGSKAKKAGESKAKKADSPKKEAPKKASDSKAKKGGAKKDAPKKDAPKKAAATPEAKAKKEAPKKEEAKTEAPKKEAPKKEPPKRNRASDFEDRAKASKASPGKRPTIPGLLFKIGKKLVSRLLS